VRHDGVVAALNVFDCCIGAVALSWVGAGGTHVGAVEAQAVGPTIVLHGNAIVGGDGRSWNRLDGQCNRWWQFGSSSGDSVGTVKATLTGCELVEAFLVFGSEICNKFVDGFGGNWAHTPLFAC